MFKKKGAKEFLFLYILGLEFDSRLSSIIKYDNMVVMSMEAKNNW